MRAANAKAASFLAASLCCDIISVKFTNCGKETEFFTDHHIQEKNNETVISYLEVIEFAVRDIIIKLFHCVPWSISYSNQDYRQWIMAAFLYKIKQLI